MQRKRTKTCKKTNNILWRRVGYHVIQIYTHYTHFIWKQKGKISNIPSLRWSLWQFSGLLTQKLANYALWVRDFCFGRFSSQITSSLPEGWDCTWAPSVAKCHFVIGVPVAAIKECLTLRYRRSIRLWQCETDPVVCSLCLSRSHTVPRHDKTAYFAVTLIAHD